MPRPHVYWREKTPQHKPDPSTGLCAAFSSISLAKKKDLVLAAAERATARLGLPVLRCWDALASQWDAHTLRPTKVAPKAAPGAELAVPILHTYGDCASWCLPGPSQVVWNTVLFSAVTARPAHASSRPLVLHARTILSGPPPCGICLPGRGETPAHAAAECSQSLRCELFPLSLSQKLPAVVGQCATRTIPRFIVDRADLQRCLPAEGPAPRAVLKCVLSLCKTQPLESDIPSSQLRLPLPQRPADSPDDFYARALGVLSPLRTAAFDPSSADVLVRVLKSQDALPGH